MRPAKRSLFGSVVEAVRPRIDEPIYWIWAVSWAVVLIVIDVYLASNPSVANLVGGAWCVVVGAAAQFAFRKRPYVNDRSAAAVKARMFRAMGPMLWIFGLTLLVTNAVQLAR